MKMILFAIMMIFGLNLLAQEPGNNDLNSHPNEEGTPEGMSLLDPSSKEAMNSKTHKSNKHKKKSKKQKEAPKDQPASK